jgi:hypothetical protein
MLGILLHAPRGPFYSPKAARSRREQSRKAILAFCRLAHRTLSGADFLPYLAKPAVGATDTVRCTPDSPVPPTSRWLGHVSRADRAADRWPGRPLARPTVGSPGSRCTPDSPVNFSRTPLITSREQQVRLSLPGAPDTIWCTQTELVKGSRCLRGGVNWAFLKINTN